MGSSQSSGVRREVPRLLCFLVLASVVPAAGVLALFHLRQSPDVTPEGKGQQAFIVRTQSEDTPENLATGKLLVARRGLEDPNFAGTVILLVQFDDDGAMGLIINRQTKISLSQLLDEVKPAKGRSDPVYRGGPVESSGIQALLRSRAKPEDGRQVFSDVYIVSTKRLLEKTLAAGTQSSAFRVYAGYAGWGPGQLEMEVDAGAWHVVAGNAAMVFDPDPGTVWTRLIEQLELKIALAPGIIAPRS